MHKPVSQACFTLPCGRSAEAFEINVLHASSFSCNEQNTCMHESRNDDYFQVSIPSTNLLSIHHHRTQVYIGSKDMLGTSAQGLGNREGRQFSGLCSDC